ncbi:MULTISPECIES: anhydro-N-acetylmuramic acid kinase [Niastella]|uniref:Anhydro-N-acetylmuramic acid kinase n=1 Tax=Niastella soli TaxID=2821487 RepID=A0ABS3YRE0_9BACT|nr:anhydro-N-acetylmuramic acid kinase [Niastella soli]MBO9200409.1 anhydro-N-acetylmuramic acid kinase [Niastella soli]
MIYRAIGLMSGSSLDGLDIAFIEFHESKGVWEYEIKAADCYPYGEEWVQKLRGAIQLNALDYQLLHTEYGHYIGEQVNAFIERHNLQYQVQLIASHGHTTFHAPAKKMTGQLGDGAAIAAVTGINVVSDLRAMDIALGGQGAPIVPIGEKLLLGNYTFFLNLGGIANISYNHPDQYLAFDVCPANRVLNMLAHDEGKTYDDGGQLAASGNLHPNLLKLLNELDYYRLPYPKSLANDFGTDVVYPLLKSSGIPTADALRTMVEHIAEQTAATIQTLLSNHKLETTSYQLLATGGGAHNTFLLERLQTALQPLGVEIVTTDKNLIDFKEALIMALIGVLRWREENNVLASVTGASRSSIGGAVWIGQEA